MRLVSTVLLADVVAVVFPASYRVNEWLNKCLKILKCETYELSLAMNCKERSAILLSVDRYALSRLSGSSNATGPDYESQSIS